MMKLFVARLASHSLCLRMLGTNKGGCLSLGKEKDRGKEVSLEGREILCFRYRIVAVLNTMGARHRLEVDGWRYRVVFQIFLVRIRCFSIACDTRMSRMRIWIERLEEELLAAEEQGS